MMKSSISQLMRVFVFIILITVAGIPFVSCTTVGYLGRGTHVQFCSNARFWMAHQYSRAPQARTLGSNRYTPTLSSTEQNGGYTKQSRRFHAREMHNNEWKPPFEIYRATVFLRSKTRVDGLVPHATRTVGAGSLLLVLR